MYHLFIYSCRLHSCCLFLSFFMFLHFFLWRLSFFSPKTGTTWNWPDDSTHHHRRFDRRYESNFWRSIDTRSIRCHPLDDWWIGWRWKRMEMMFFILIWKYLWIVGLVDCWGWDVFLLPFSPGNWTEDAGWSWGGVGVGFRQRRPIQGPNPLVNQLTLHQWYDGGELYKEWLWKQNNG